MLDKDLTFFLAVRDGKKLSNHSMPNVIAAEINTSIDMLKTSFFSKEHESIPFKLNYFTETEIFNSLAHSRAVAEFSVRPVQNYLRIKGELRL